MDYRTIASVPTDDDKALRRVEEGAVLPTTAIRTQENLVQLHKRGRMLVASYEAIRFQRLDLFSVTLRQIGAYIARMHLEDAVQVLMNGDGNNNAADAYEIGSGSGQISGTAGTLTYSALLDFWAKFDPYSMNTMLVSNDVMLQMLKLSEFQNPLTGLNFQGTGTLSTPLGAKLLRTSAVPAGKLIGLDKNYALEHDLRQRGDGGVRQAHRPPDRARGDHEHFGLCQALSGGLQGADRLTAAGSERRESDGRGDP